MSYSPPFRLYLVTDPVTGKRSQVVDKDKAEELAGSPANVVPSKHWYSRRHLGGRKVQRVNTKKTTKHEAQRWVQERNAASTAGLAEPRKQGFTVAVTLWLEEKRLGRLATKTLTDYRSVVSFWKDELGSLTVSTINQDDILRYFSRRESGELGAERRKEREKEREKTSPSREGKASRSDDEPKKPGPRVLAKDRVLLGSFFRWARKRGLCTGNPVEDAPRWRQEEKEPQALTREEVTRLLDACRKPYKQMVTRKGFREYSSEIDYLPPPHLFGIVLTALHSLLRLGNVVGLTWGELDLERGLIKLAPGRVKTRRELEVKMTPTLKAYFESLPRAAPAAPVFGESAGSIKKSFKSAAKRAGLAGLKFHCLRKTGATLLLDSGVPLHVVQHAGGWKKPDVLLKHYAAATAAQKDRAVAVLDELGA